MKVLSLAILLTGVTCHLALAQIGGRGGPGGPPPGQTTWTITNPSNGSNVAAGLTSIGTGGQRTPAGVSAYNVLVEDYLGGLNAAIGFGSGNSNPDGSWSTNCTVSGIQAGGQYSITVKDSSTGQEKMTVYVNGV